MTDWSSEYGTFKRFQMQTNHKEGQKSRVVYCQTGERQREFYSKQPIIAPGVRRCSRYRRAATVAQASVTIRNDNGKLAYIYPERLHGLDFATFSSNWRNMRNQAEVECLNKLTDQKAQLINDLLEAKQTFDMLADVTTRGAKFLLNLKRGRFVEAGKSLLGPSFKGHPKMKPRDYWLQYQYGWKPLADSVYSYQELLKGYTDKSKIVRVAREVKEDLTDNVNGYQKGGRYTDARGTIQHHNSVKVILYGIFENDYIRLAKSWGVYSPQSIAWEATPYSFVVDWFCPVGNVLSAWSASAGVRFLTGCRQERAVKRGNMSLIATSIDMNYNRGSVVQRSEYTLEMTSVNRYVYDDFPTPLPYFKNPFSTTKAVTALALLRQLRS